MGKWKNGKASFSAMQCVRLSYGGGGRCHRVPQARLKEKNEIKTWKINPGDNDEEDMLKGIDIAAYIVAAAERLKMAHLPHLAKKNWLICHISLSRYLTGSQPLPMN